jgi:chemotaxis response regulator CheB
MKKQVKPTRRQTKSGNAVLKETPTPQTDDSRGADQSFPIVGIGASAGGLDALELFLGSVPEKSGMAFVIVQHPDPTHKGLMVELLQRATPMPVVQVKNRMKVEPDCAYVIPPAGTCPSCTTITKPDELSQRRKEN